VIYQHLYKALADLANVDVVIDEKDKALILLSSLPDKGYETFVLTLINERTSLSYSKVTTALINLELRRKDKESLGGTSAEALAVRGRSPNQKGGNRGRSKSRSRYNNRSLTRDQCAFCKQTGHWNKDCPELKKKNKMKEKSGKPSEVNVAKSGGNESDSSAFSLSITPSIYYPDASDWLLDTGATYHICPKREWFYSLDKLDSGIIIMGNDVACKMIGIGTIRIKIFDSMVRNLTDRRYVPQMKKNIISVGVGAVESKGLKVMLKNEILKVTKGSFVVIKGIKDRNLYYLKGSTVTGSLTAPVVSDVDATQL